MTRARRLIEYVMHPLGLARAGGERTAAAEAFFRHAYLPLANAAWKWRSGFGFTDVDHLLMRHFLSEQVYAIRHDAGTHPAEGPSGRLGFAWAPENVPSEPDFPAKTAGLQQRLVVRVRGPRRAAASQMGACGPPGDHVWCEGAYDGAAFKRRMERLLELGRRLSGRTGPSSPWSALREVGRAGPWPGGLPVCVARARRS